MESIIARALEYTLKYWLKSFNRDQFKLQGRTAQLSNLDINGEALHASVGLPPALNVSRARVGKLEIILPSLSNVQVEPIYVQIDRLDLVLEEKDDLDASSNSSSFLSSISSAKGTGYGFADKIADGMTVQIGTVNLLLETHGGPRHVVGPAGASPMASITMRNLLLYTTNENWEVVNLKEARDFSLDKKFIYVFKKLEWGSLSVDLLPHPDTFLDANFSDTKEGNNMKDKDGAKRAFFGGERLIEGISGEANITIQRTQLNSPLGLEVQLHISEVVCPALSEPGLRALLRFFMGLSICINRGDLNPNTQQLSAEAAGRSLVSVIVDHIFLCIKDTEFRLEFLMQSLFCSRASVSNGENAKYLTRVMIGGLFLRDTFSHPPCTLVQPSMEDPSANVSHVPDFGKDFCPPIYPLGDQQSQLNCNVPLLSLHFLQLLPTPNPPVFSSRTVIDCQPLMIHLQEDSCLRIASFLADEITVDPTSVLPDFSINSLVFKLKGIDVISPLELGESKVPSKGHETSFQSSYAGARLRIEDFIFSLSPSLKLRLLNLEKDPACFCLWRNQPVDASQRKLAAEASLISLSLEPHDNLIRMDGSPKESGLWRCIEMEDICIEVAMVTADGSPLTNIPPPEGVVRVGVACQQYLSYTSVEQLFFVLNLYTHYSRVSEKIAVLGKNKNGHGAILKSFGGNTTVKAPGDTAATLVVKDMKLRFLESPADAQGLPLVCFMGTDLSIKVSHRTLGGAMAISSTLVWKSVEVDCTDTMNDFRTENGSDFVNPESNNLDGKCRQLRAVFWVQNSRIRQADNNTVTVPFLNVHTVHMIPYKAQDIECHSLNVSACITGVRLVGGMSYTESLLHRFGIFGPDGGPGEGLTRGIEHLADGPLLKLFKASFPVMDGSRENETYDNGQDSSLHLGVPDDVDVSIEFKDWLFALEGTHEMVDKFSSNELEYSYREERSWHTTFRSLRIKAKGNENHATDAGIKRHGNQKYPIELITVEMDGIQILKPTVVQGLLSNGTSDEGSLQDDLPKNEPSHDRFPGVNIAADIMISEDDIDDTIANWTVENFKFSVNEPIEAAVKKDELQYLCILCKSEVDSVGRIAAGVLRILKLEGSLGPAAISQLSNLGSGSIDRIFTPEKLSRGSSPSTLELSPSSTLGWSSSVEPTITSLEEAVLDSKMKCAAIATELSSSGSSSKSLSNITQLSEKLESIQKLINQLKTQF